MAKLCKQIVDLDKGSNMRSTYCFHKEINRKIFGNLVSKIKLQASMTYFTHAYKICKATI